MYDDENAWCEINNDDLWIFDKLILARKLGYICGPSGVDVPKPNFYIVRPITNINGMGIGAEIVWLEDSTDHLPPGYFWCEVFQGPHFSVDFEYGKQTLCVQGFRNVNDPLYKWYKWERCSKQFNYPSILSNTFQYVNCEFIDNKIIEIHLRLNPDFEDGIDVIYPVWKGEDTDPPPGMRFINTPDYLRVGFFTPI